MTTVIIGLELKTPEYKAKVKMLVVGDKQIDSPYYNELPGYRNAEVTLTQGEIVKSNDIIERVVKTLKLDERPIDHEKEFCSPLREKLIAPDIAKFEARLEQMAPEEKKAYLLRRAMDALRVRIEVEPIQYTSLFTIAVRDFDRFLATKIVNLLSRVYVMFDVKLQMVEIQQQYGDKHPMVKQLKDTIENMEKRFTDEDLSGIESIGPMSVKIVESAQVPLKPSSTSKTKVFLFAAFLGVFLGLCLSFGFEYMDNTFKSPQDIETFLDLPVLGYTTKKNLAESALIKNMHATTNYSQSYRVLSDQMYLLLKEKKLKTVLFSSTLLKEGTSTIVANLGIQLANRLNHKILVVDANLRDSSMHKLFRIPGDPGLAGVLEEKATIQEAIIEVDSNLSVLSAGKTFLNPITLLNSTKMLEIIKTVKEKYEIILFDGTNLGIFKDTYVLAPCLDSFALVIKECTSRQQIVKRAIEPFKGNGVNMLGVIFNQRSFYIPRSIYNRI